MPNPPSTTRAISSLLCPQYLMMCMHLCACECYEHGDIHESTHTRVHFHCRNCTIARVPTATLMQLRVFGWVLFCTYMSRHTTQILPHSQLSRVEGFGIRLWVFVVCTRGNAHSGYRLGCRQCWIAFQSSVRRRSSFQYAL